MTPVRLRTFLAVVDTGSARAAAKQLSVTESAVSASLAALRREVGVGLFEREGRGLRLTESGAVFAGYARRILGLIDEGVAATRQGVAAERGRLRLGAVTTAGESLIPGLLASFRRRYPQMELTLDVGVRDRVFALLADHRLDVVIGGRPGPGMVTRATRANALMLVAAAGQLPDPATATWLLREAGSGTREATLALHQTLQIQPPLLTLGSVGAVVSSAVLGLGITLVSADAVEPLLHDGALQRVPLPGVPLRRPWHAVTSSAPTATTELFLSHLTDPRHAGALVFRRARVVRAHPGLRPRG